MRTSTNCKIDGAGTQFYSIYRYSKIGVCNLYKELTLLFKRIILFPNCCFFLFYFSQDDNYIKSSISSLVGSGSSLAHQRFHILRSAASQFAAATSGLQYNELLNSLLRCFRMSASCDKLSVRECA